VSLTDFRKLIDLGPGRSYIAVQVTEPTAHRPVVLELNVEGHGVVVPLEEGEAGELFDALAAALRTVVGGLASAKLHPDTPPSGTPLSGPSGNIQPRG
jgi:hypothetical protein